MDCGLVVHDMDFSHGGHHFEVVDPHPYSFDRVPRSFEVKRRRGPPQRQPRPPPPPRFFPHHHSQQQQQQRAYDDGDDDDDAEDMMRDEDILAALLPQDSPKSVTEFGRIQKIIVKPPLLPPPLVRLEERFSDSSDHCSSEASYATPLAEERRPHRRDLRSSEDLLDDLLEKRTTLDSLRVDATARGPGYVGAYSPRARKARVALFLQKRSRRVWTKKVKYDVRKNFADSRMRVKGRFVKKEDEDMLKELVSIVI